MSETVQEEAGGMEVEKIGQRVHSVPPPLLIEEGRAKKAPRTEFMENPVKQRKSSAGKYSLHTVCAASALLKDGRTDQVSKSPRLSNDRQQRPPDSVEGRGIPRGRGGKQVHIVWAVFILLSK